MEDKYTTIIKRFSDGSILEYGQGNFDDWCVFLTRPRALKYAPRDVDYLAQLKGLAKRHTADRIYRDFVLVYEQTGTHLEPNVLDIIAGLAKNYPPDQREMEMLLSILYASMVAEENKRGAILKKRIKRLAVHQILMEDVSPAVAAVFSKGKTWRFLAKECQNRGF